MYYKFSWKRNLFWHSRMVTGHKYEEKQNKMLIFFKDGGVQEIKHWTDCEVKLGADWFSETKKQMEDKAGQAIPMKVG